jgi:asparagine synthase (glutamine-hydrolysing)
MCGFAGVFDRTEQRNISAQLLVDMSGAVAHRGPDDCASYRAPGLGLRHHRLALVDTSGGKQPMCSPDGGAVLVFNGFIYNYVELRAALERLGASFRTRSDTEVVLQAWLAWGPDCARHLRGMFAFAIWDRAERCLHLARDPLGIKPLFYTSLPDGTVAFASDLRAFFRVPSFRRELLPTSIEDYLAFGYIPEPATLFRDAAKLPAGSTLTLRHGQPVGSPVTYWKPWRSRPERPLDEREAEGVLIDSLQGIVENCLASDHRVGILLSGGVDSSAVLWAAARKAAAPIPAFTLAVDHQGYDESQFAAMAVRHVGADHHMVPLGTPGPDAIDRLAVQFDEPFADSSAFPTSMICRRAKQEVPVVMSGDGGDELFAGYRRYREVSGTVEPGTGPARRSRLVDAYMERVSVVPSAVRRDLYERDFARSLQGYSAAQVMRRAADDAPVDDEVELLQYLDLRTYLQGDILTKVDRTSMTHALEVRVPMLDHTFVDMASSLPTRARIRGSEGKWIFKKALEPHLPDELLYRQKMGFSVPIHRWLAGHLRDHVRDRLASSVLIDAAVFDRRRLDALLDDPSDTSEVLWSLLMLEGYCREYVFA